MTIVGTDNLPISDHRFSFSYDSSTKVLSLVLNKSNTLNDVSTVFAKIVETDDTNNSNKVESSLEIRFTDPCAGISIVPP